ncbi:hypothetical protein [Odoribacter lunatus]|uniref:hypothetical protein n=1 Tax=Odoribacter lunatus TaxID=2941335 RepID=UPI00203E5F60|nr:hypothetical protein [Odoribacter lunatus]
MNSIDLGWEESPKIPFEKRSHISILLGAGFSAPKGYPTGNDINKALLNLEKTPIFFNTEGKLSEADEKTILENREYPNPYEKYFSFCKEIISVYAKEQEFDYEYFFDFIKSEAIYAEQYKTIRNKYMSNEISYHELITSVSSIYNQVVAYFIKDSDGYQKYEHFPYRLGYVEHYDNFLKLLSNLKERYIIDVHTLNHDLFFESLNKTEYINGDISDGFDEFGSEYYGLLPIENESYHCRLKRYTGYYNTAIRLYKLHGSINYILYYKDCNNILLPDKCIKLPAGISPSYLLKGKGSKKHYEESPFTDHANFLTGTTSKIRQYNSPYFYKKLFHKFRKNLKKSTNLIIIGYGGRDSGINNILLECYKNKPVYIITPDAQTNENIKKLAAQLHAETLSIGVQDIQPNLI